GGPGDPGRFLRGRRRGPVRPGLRGPRVAFPRSPPHGTLDAVFPKPREAVPRCPQEQGEHALRFLPRHQPNGGAGPRVGLGSPGTGAGRHFFSRLKTWTTASEPAPALNSVGRSFPAAT